MAYGSYDSIDDRPTLRFERRIKHPVEAVWRAITEPEQLAQWFPSEVELELEPGGRMTFTFPQPRPDGGNTLAGEVLDLDPPNLFGFLWGEDRLIFELEPLDEGAACLLRFTVILDARDKAARDAAGWHVCLDALERVLDAGRVDRPYGEGDWRSLYDAYSSRGFPVGAWLPD
jgi:uncharacterized protein YndB with AHSA1/START domain